MMESAQWPRYEIRIEDLSEMICKVGGVLFPGPDLTSESPTNQTLLTATMFVGTNQTEFSAHHYPNQQLRELKPMIQCT
jgi:hypothetical protein